MTYIPHLAVIVVAFLFAGSGDLPAAIATAEVVAARFPDLSAHLHCPKLDAQEWTLKHEIAHRADSGEWTVQCIYTEN